MTTTTPHLRPAVAGFVLLASILAACSGGAASPPAATGPSAAPASASPGGVEPAPGGSDPGVTDPSGGGSVGDPGSGVGGGAQPPVVDPGPGQPKIVTALPGRLNPHPVAPIKIETAIDGRHVLVKLTWYSGVEPCSVLDSVQVQRSGNEIALTPIEGASNLNAACIDIAVLKATIVDLGDVDPGTYRLTSPGSDAPPVDITIG